MKYQAIVVFLAIVFLLGSDISVIQLGEAKCTHYKCTKGIEKDFDWLDTLMEIKKKYDEQKKYDYFDYR